MMNEVGVATPKKEPLLPGWLKVLLIIVGVLVVLAVLTWVLLDVTTRRDVSAEVARIQALGWPTNIRDLSPQPIPASENAALTYEQVFLQHRARLTGLLYRVSSPQAWRGLNAEDQAEVREVLANSGAVLDLLHQAARMPQCQFDVEYLPGSAWAHVRGQGDMIDLAWLKRAQVLLDLVDGRSDEAFEHWLDLAAMVRHQEGHKAVSAEHVRLCCLKPCIDALQALVRTGALSAEQLTRASQALKSIAGRKSLADSLKASVVLAAGMFQRPEMIGDPRPGPSKGVADFYGYKAMFSLYRSRLGRPWRQHDEATFLRLLREGIAAGDRPYHQAHTQLAQWKHTRQVRRDSWPAAPLTGLRLEDLEELWLELATGEAWARVARTAVALERYRLLHGDYPDPLADLAPALLAEVHVDPFDGQPLRYIRTPDRVAVYSVGWDTLDGGGSGRSTGSRGPEDVVFDLRRSPKQGGQRERE